MVLAGEAERINQVVQREFREAAADARRCLWCWEELLEFEIVVLWQVVPGVRVRWTDPMDVPGKVADKYIWKGSKL